MGWQIARQGTGLADGLIGALLPDNLFPVGQALFHHLMDEQAVSVLVNATMTTVIVAVSALSFPLKEKLSASYERDTAASGSELPRPLTLWKQELEEI